MTSDVHASRHVVAQRGRPNIMMHNWRVVVFTLSTLSLAAADQAWKGKQFPEWTEDDAKEVMTDSPWAKTVTPTQATSPDQDNRTASGGSRRRGGIGVGGIGIGLPGMGGIGQRVNQPGAQSDKTNTSPATASVQLPKLTVRWESALPMREAELKAREAGAPTVDEDHYAIAVFGIPRSSVIDDSKKTADSLRKQAVLKPEGKRDLKPSSVEILLREDGPVVVYSFPKSDEITWRDHRIDSARVNDFETLRIGV
jgi:hypothetical protein